MASVFQRPLTARTAGPPMWTTAAQATSAVHRQLAGIGADLRVHSKIEPVTSEQNKTFDLSASFKAYDVRGIVGESITAQIVEAVGAAFIDVLGLEGGTVLVGRRHAPVFPGVQQSLRQGRSNTGSQRAIAGPDLHR